MAKPLDPANRIVFRLCPRCFRAVPGRLSEHYCTNCGQQMLTACPDCHSPITSPEARFCGQCGADFAHSRTSH